MTELLENPWVQRVGFVVGGLVVGIVLEFVVIRRAHKLAERTRFKWDDLLIGSLRGVATTWSGAGGVYLALNVGTPDPLLLSTMQSVLMVVLIGSVVIAGTRAVGGAVEMVSARAGGALESPTLVVNLARIAVATLGFFIILQNLGIDITALITALGIGGIAIALALQDTLGNLFAGIQIILSKQVRQRDYIRLSSGEEGWVTDVKGRNTTIQTFPDGNLVTVPNSMLASSIVKIFSDAQEGALGDSRGRCELRQRPESRGGRSLGGGQTGTRGGGWRRAGGRPHRPLPHLRRLERELRRPHDGA